MALAYNISSVAPPIAKEFVTYVPSACKPKPKKSKPTPKAKSVATTTTAEHSRSGADPKDDGERFSINDEFTLPDSNASPPTLYEPTDASHSIDSSNIYSLIVTSQQNLTSIGQLNAFAGFSDAFELENLGHDQFGGESLDKGWPDHAAWVAEGDPATRGLLGGISQGKHAKGREWQ
jgi:hypothetical protein